MLRGEGSGSPWVLSMSSIFLFNLNRAEAKSANCSKVASKDMEPAQPVRVGAPTSSSDNQGWRDATPADHEALTSLVLALYREDPATVPMTTEKVERTLAVLAAEPVRGRAVVLEVEGVIAAYALLCSFWSNELGGEVCILDELYVAESHRGRGLATSFVKGLVGRVLPWFSSAVAVELEVTPSNARARALYERLGFEPCKNAMMRCVRPVEGS